MTFYEAREQFIRRYLADLLRRHKPREAARVAGLNRTHLYGLAKRYGVQCGKPLLGQRPRPVAARVENKTASRFLAAHRGDGR